MVDPVIRYQRWDIDGTLVEDYEVTKPVEQYNAEVITERAAAALANNLTYLAIPTPTQAQAVAQVADLTRQVNALIRLALNRFDSSD